MVRVETGARLHFGFQNLSLARERLYGGVGVALTEPRVVVEAERADDTRVGHDDTRLEHDDTRLEHDDARGGRGSVVDASASLSALVDRVVEVLGVPGAHVRAVETLPRHVGLGSGTQHALAVYAAVARAYDRPVDVRAASPRLGRGGRSGVGVATFESGGVIVDGGHPVERFTTETPARGEWTVPPVVARHPVPDDWRFVLAIPGGEGRHGVGEDASMRSAIERADPDIADELAGVLTRRVLPAIVENRPWAFGRAVGTFGRLNGAWYADEQGGVYRPPAGAIVDALSGSDALAGAGQSSWGPTVYAVSTASHVDEARAAARAALDAAGSDGAVVVARGRNEGATVE